MLIENLYELVLNNMDDEKRLIEAIVGFLTSWWFIILFLTKPQAF